MDEKLIAAIIGFVSGVLGTFIAPWVGWGIEKRRMKQQNRKEAVATWRQVIYRVAKGETYSDAGELDFLLHQEPEFLRLKALLSPEVQELFARNEVGSEQALEALQSDLSRIEKEWKLL